MPNFIDPASMAAKVDKFVRDYADCGDSDKQKELIQEVVSSESNFFDVIFDLAMRTTDTTFKRVFLLLAMTIFEEIYGQKFFDENMASFWEVEEAKPYIYLCIELAELHWRLKERQDAIEQAENILELDMDDNLGMRYTLVNWYIYTGDFKSAQSLMHEYADGSTFMLYSALLYDIRKNPANTAKHKKLLKSAKKENPFVLEYLLGIVPMPDDMPDTYEFGDKNEAIVYCHESLDAWKGPTNSIHILRKILK